MLGPCVTVYSFPKEEVTAGKKAYLLVQGGKVKIICASEMICSTIWQKGAPLMEFKKSPMSTAPSATH